MYIEQAAAKINLTLQIVGKLPNGMHALESFVVFAGLADRLDIMPNEAAQNDISLTLHGAYGARLAHILDDTHDNLVMRAAYALREAAQISCGAALQLEKNIPIMSGLGGGSADAAAALRLLNRFWKLDWPVEKLLPLAVQLGADVPVCLLSQPAWMRGYGEQVQALTPPESALLPLPDFALLLVKPDIALSTDKVFAHFDKAHKDAAYSKQSAPLSQGFASLDELVQFIAKRGNDLTSSAAVLAPIIPDICKALDGAGARIASMSGSGATCFGIFETHAQAEKAAAIISTQFPSSRQMVTHPQNNLTSAHAGLI